MTEAAAPHGEPYALAMALLAKHSGALPGAMVLFPDGIIWTQSTQNAETLQLHEEAAAMLGALRARRVPVALLVPGTPGTAGRARCSLEAAGLSGQLIAVVEVDAVAAAAAAGGCADKGSDPNGCWARLKAVLGCPWQEMLCFAADATTLRDAAALGAATCRVRGVLRLDALERGLTTYSSKQSDDRGY